MERTLFVPIRCRAPLAMLLLCVSACGGDDAATAPSRTPDGLRRVQGRVTDFTSGAPLANTALAFGADVGALDRRTTTDANGVFTVGVPAGRIHGAIDGAMVGELAVHDGGPPPRGDLLANGGTCVSRYGVISDAATFQPVAGATVRLGGRSMVTGGDGWYRIDLGCDLNPLNNFGTATINVTHPGYRDLSRVVGRGIHFVNRLDLDLARP
jgi:hypothetical protein